MKHFVILTSLMCLAVTGCINSPTSYNLTGNIGYSSRSGYGGSADTGSESTGTVSEVWLDTHGGGNLDAQTDVGFDPDATAVP